MIIRQFLRETKDDTFSCNSILRCLFAEATAFKSLQEDKVPHLHKNTLLVGSSTESAHGYDTRSALHDQLRLVETIQASD